jgi:hypothetical protein
LSARRFAPFSTSPGFARRLVSLSARGGDNAGHKTVAQCAAGQEPQRQSKLKC